MSNSFAALGVPSNWFAPPGLPASRPAALGVPPSTAPSGSAPASAPAFAPASATSALSASSATARATFQRRKLLFPLTQPWRPRRVPPPPAHDGRATKLVGAPSAAKELARLPLHDASPSRELVRDSSKRRREGEETQSEVAEEPAGSSDVEIPSPPKIRRTGLWIIREINDVGKHRKSISHPPGFRLRREKKGGRVQDRKRVGEAARGEGPRQQGEGPMSGAGREAARGEAASPEPRRGEAAERQGATPRSGKRQAESTGAARKSSFAPLGAATSTIPEGTQPRMPPPASGKIIHFGGLWCCPASLFRDQAPSTPQAASALPAASAPQSASALPAASAPIAPLAAAGSTMDARQDMHSGLAPSSFAPSALASSEPLAPSAPLASSDLSTRLRSWRVRTAEGKFAQPWDMEELHELLVEMESLLPASQSQHLAATFARQNAFPALGVPSTSSPPRMLGAR